MSQRINGKLSKMFKNDENQGKIGENQENQEK